MTALALRATMLGDWHVGSGTSRHAHVDRLVQRDADGLPYIPAKSLAGVWRDACETVVHALDGGGSGPWHGWLVHLFGSQPALEERGVLDSTDGGPPRPAALLLDGLHYPPALADALRGRPALRQAAVFLKPGVALDDATGRADDRMLRLEEMARGGTVLTGHAELDGVNRLDEAQLACAWALLDASARLVEGVGGKRRRGAGRCRLDLVAPPADWRRLRGLPVPPPLPTPAAPARPEPLPVAADRQDQQEGWELADLRLVLHRPLVAHERTVGNAVRSAGRVPGWTLLPAVLERLDAPAAALAARRGELAVTDATLEVDGVRGRPAPLALLHAKGEGTARCNLLAETPAAGVPMESFDGHYVGVHRPGRPLVPRRCTLTEHTHNTIDDRRQRPVKELGGLYTYQALAAGTVLRARVRVPAGLLPAGWQERLSGTWRLGRSRKDGYGLTEVTAVPAEEPALRAVPAGPLRVWLLSDVLVLDERLRPSTRPEHLAAELGRALGVELRPADGAGGPGPAGRVGEPHRSDPWHRRWGLPRPSLLGLAAGSCLSFDVVAGKVTPEAVRRVETAGVGLRRAEGFGQLAVGDPLLYTALDGADAPAEPAEPGEPGRPSSDGQEQAFPGGVLEAHGAAVAVLEEAAWRQEIRRRCEALAGGDRDAVLGEDHRTVPASQLGGLRTLVAHLQGPGDRRTRTWFERLRPTPGGQRRRPWPDGTVERVGALLTEPGTVWDLLDLPEDMLTGHPDRIPDLRERLWPHAVRTLVEDCLTAHARTTRTRGEDAR
ncbi:RAMP superfamily CRISPR-associated protein [Streptomyces sp. NPDC001380]|uniref:RAMP superfamily CRISPR-associated protein n=1 Tax=Streptomyces sp. NPDC001380 TaxID=3364566 RepID=UPI0036C8BB11